MKYIGDFPAGTTNVTVKFNTTQFSDGAPITLAGSPVVKVYKNGSTTESTAGVTLSVDYDTRTGYHDVTIDTSQDGTFYAAGNDFSVVITTGTVGGTSVVGREVGSFSLQNRTRTGYSLASTGLDLVLVDGKTLPAALQIVAAVVAGKVSGAGTGTETFVGLDGVTTRVTVTADSSGNRSVVVYA